MAVVIGKSDVMDIAEESFISSTYWTERIGPTSSIATINKMKENNVQKHLNKIGNSINNGWKKLGNENGIKINIKGIPPLTTFTFDYDNSPALNTLFTQEMLKRGFLASKSVYVSYSHTESHVTKYLNHVDDVFKIIKYAIEEENVHELLKGPIVHDGFKRLT